MDMIKTEHYNISYKDSLPKIIDYPLELIKSLTEKLTTDDDIKNINGIFKWVPLGKEILARYNEATYPEIQNFRYALAWALYDMSEEENVLEIANTIINSLEIIPETDNKVISSYYWLLSSAQNICGDYQNALANIKIAINMNEDSPNSYCTMGEILSNENKFEEAENNLKESLEKVIKIFGEDDLHTALIYDSYSKLYYKTEQTNKCLEFAEKAYEIFYKHLGESHLYTVRCLANWGVFLYFQDQYKEALEKMKPAAQLISKIFGKNQKELIAYKENANNTQVLLNKNEEILKNFENKAFITDNKEILLVLSYCNITMDAPKLVCKIKDSQIFNSALLNKDMKCAYDAPLASALYDDCELFDTIPEKYWRNVVEILAKQVKLIKDIRPDADFEYTPFDQLRLELGYNLIPLVDKDKDAELLEHINRIRKEIALELGLVLPRIRLIDNMGLEPAAYSIKLNEVEMCKCSIHGNRYLCVNSTNTKIDIPHEGTVDPTFGLPAMWISEEYREEAEKTGLTVVDPPAIIATHLTEIIKTHADKILDRQGTKKILKEMEIDYPVVVEEVQKLLSLGEIKKVLQNLLHEQVSIRNIPAILESICDNAPISRNIDFLTKKVRQALGLQICMQYADKTKTLHILTIEKKIEQKIIYSAVDLVGSRVCVLKPEMQKKWIKAIKEQILKAEQIIKMREQSCHPVILCSEQARALVKQSIEKEIPELAVISVSEIVQDINVVHIGEIQFEV